MHPTHINDVDTTNHNSNHLHQANNNRLTNLPLHSSHNGPTAVASNTNGHEHALKYPKERNNGDASANANGNANTNGSSNGSPLHQNGGPAANTNTANGYQNGTRRDSTQAWTPLLANGNGNTGGGGGGGGGGDEGGGGSANGNGIVSATNGDLPESTTVLYGTPSNNNEWKDAEQLNNLKNGLLHYPPAHQGNNNGSLMNGKNGIGLSDKYGEQDPLTGLYNSPKHTHPREPDESDSDSDLSTADRKQPACGLFGCRPKWARNFASTHVFMVVFLLAYILQGMYMTYFVSVITTIEKLFQIKSKTTGLLLSASEMGQISTAMLLTYFAGRGHRPRWIACGMVLFSIAAFACSLPHFIFGKQLIHSLSSLNNGGNGGGALQASAGGQMLSSSYGLNVDMSALNATLRGDFSTVHPMNGATIDGKVYTRSQNLNLCVPGNNFTKANSECNEDRKLEQASHSKITVIVLCIFFASLLSSGIGQTAVATLGIPYIDDNVASKQSPMYMAITIGVRILGPASGFIVGSFCTRWYVNFSNPGFDASDPRWIGAWWLGPVVIGSLMMLSSIAMFSFPRQLRGKRKPTAGANETTDNGGAAAEVEEKPKLKDFPKTVRRQLSNDILMFRTASCVFHLLPIAGLYTFLPKYLETQFRLTSYDANMTAAFCGILVMGVGIVISGLVILKLKPSARSVAAWIAFTALVYSAGMVILMFVGCNMSDFAGYKAGTHNTSALIGPACNATLDCTCEENNFAPICGVDGKIYTSTCHAGCTTSGFRTSDNRTTFSNCACIPDSLDNPEPYEAVNGYCDSNCKNFIFFILIFAVCVFMHSTSEVGSMLLVMRCTHPKDKAMAMGIIQSAIGLFGNVPCPIIYGAVVDSACLLWKTVCEKHGACSLYDADTFRHYFLGITAGIMFLAFIMDLVVWSKAHRIDIAPEDNNDNNKTAETECKKSMVTPDTSV